MCLSTDYQPLLLDFDTFIADHSYFSFTFPPTQKLLTWWHFDSHYPRLLALSASHQGKSLTGKRLTGLMQSSWHGLYRKQEGPYPGELLTAKHSDCRNCWSGPPAYLDHLNSRGLSSCNKSPDLTPGQCCHSAEDKQCYSSKEVSAQKPAPRQALLLLSFFSHSC